MCPCQEWKDAGATDDLWSQPSRPGKAHAAQGGLGSIQFRDEMRAFHQDNMPEISFQGFMESLKEKAAEKSGLVAGSKESHRSFLRRAFRESPRPKHMPFNAWLKGLLSDEDEEMEDEEEGLEEAEGKAKGKGKGEKNEDKKVEDEEKAAASKRKVEDICTGWLPDQFFQENWKYFKQCHQCHIWSYVGKSCPLRCNTCYGCMRPSCSSFRGNQAISSMLQQILSAHNHAIYKKSK